MSTNEDKLAEDLDSAQSDVADAARELVGSITPTGRSASEAGRVVIEVAVGELTILSEALLAWKNATEAMLAGVGS